MNKFSFSGTICLIISFLIYAGFRSPDHVEVVGNFEIIHYENEISVKAYLEKHHLTLALQSEGNCEPRDMLKVCGDQYLQSHFEMILNGKTAILEAKGMTIERDFIIYQFTCEAPEKIEKIRINSTYMQSYNPHALVRIGFNVHEQERMFQIKLPRKSILAKF